MSIENELKKMEKKLDSIYRQYESEVSEKWNSFFDKMEKRLSDVSEELAEARASGDREAISIAEEKYQKAVTLQTIKNQQYKAVVEETAFKMANVNQMALDIINDKMPTIYAFSYNEFEDTSLEIKGYSFDLVDESTVKMLAKDDKILLPYKELDEDKDVAWSKKAINSQLMQGILQGESIPHIAQRLRNVEQMEKKASIRNARTMTTSAENAGRQDSYEKATADGVIMHKVWMATFDERTRRSHDEANGQEVEINEPFILTNPDGSIAELMFPADSNGEPCQVYNCRCTMRTKILGFKGKQIEEPERREAFPQRPERPKKDSFTDEDEYYKARDEYKIQRTEYEEKIQKILDEEINKPRQYDTKESVLEWCEQNNVRIDDAVLDKLDLRIMDDVISVQEEMFDRFPMIKERQDQYYPYGFSMEDNSNFLFEASRGLNFGDCWSNYEIALKTNVLDAFGEGFLTIGDGTVKTTIRHEFGHNVDSYIRSTLREQYHMDDMSWRTSFSSLEEYKIAETEYFNNIREYSKDLKELTKTYCSTVYAFTNEAESFAEGFAEYTSNPNSEYGKAFGEFLKRWI